ncbi:MAG: hypothetical protein KGR18_06960 [Acidobacteria bacterium]|nr:hypothetical protein [Acidobacteriota bacterium]
MHHLRIWADADGESHLEEVTLDVTVAPAEPGVAELWVSDAVAVDRAHFVTVQAVEQVPDWHCAPRRQFVVFLDGWVRITASDGESRHLPAGSVVLVEDLTGRGHLTEHEPGVRRVLLLPL